MVSPVRYAPGCVRVLSGFGGAVGVMSWRVLLLLAGVRLAGVMLCRAVFGQGWPGRVVLLSALV
jgi:hypothetical protein